MLTDRVREWERGGEYTDFRGHRIFVRKTAGEGPPLLLLHGFPTASYDFHTLLAALPDRATIAFDFLGFGLSDKPRDHDYTLVEQADLVEQLAPDEPVEILAHDIGTSVVTELMARGGDTIAIDRIVMLNGSMLQDVASPTRGQRILASKGGPLFARVMSERSFIPQFRQIFAQPLGDEEAKDLWSLIAHNDGKLVLPKTIAYMDERRRLADRWHGAFRDWQGDLRLVWGMKDPVATPAVLAGLKELRPGVEATELPDVGHYPQIEAPEAVRRTV